MPDIRVVVVEDERIVALHLQQQLRKLGYTVPAIAANGALALAKIGEIRPDVVLMDIHIEGDIDGIETAARIPQEWQIPVVYLTAYSDETTLARARATKPYGYLVKPFSERELHATIQMVLERRRTEAALREHERLLEQMVAERTAALSGALARVEAEMAERAAAEMALRQAQKMEAVGQLTGGVAHDFNNLLTVVLGALEMIQSNPQNVSRTDRLCRSAISTVERGVRLIRQLLMFSRRQAMHPELIDPANLVMEFQPLIERAVGRDVGLEICCDPGVDQIRVDVSEFQTALLNVIINAREAVTDRKNSGGGRVTIEATNVMLDAHMAQPPLAPGPYVVIGISDTGVGMTPEVLARVFDPFFTTRDIGKGSGLGLSQVYGFVQESGGDVLIDSEPGVGTTVRLYLPRAAAASLAAAAPAALLRPAVHPGLTVLVVEDETPVLDLAAECVAEAGYRVLVAHDAAEALAVLCADERVDVLFSDVVMPGGMNGVQLAVEARRLRPGIKVLLTSGYMHREQATNEAVAGERGFLPKPYRLKDLTETLSAIAA
jgi:signal transduction histidine kinase